MKRSISCALLAGVALLAACPASAQMAEAPSNPSEAEEGEEILEEFKGSPAIDAGLLAAAQAVEHYEIARYGTLKSWAMQLGKTDVAKLFEQTLLEETKTDQVLTQLAEAKLNRKGEQKVA